MSSTSSTVLPQGAGYGVGIGLFFSALMLGLTAIQSRYTPYKSSNSEEFSSASRSVKPGLIASGIVSAWTWAATLVSCSSVRGDKANTSYTDIAGLTEDTDLDPAELDKAFKFAAWSSLALSPNFQLVIMILLIPLPLFFTQTIFGVRGLEAWVIIGIIWAFLSTFTVVLYPLWESREALLMVSRGILKDIFGGGAGKYTAPSRKSDFEFSGVGKESPIGGDHDESCTTVPVQFDRLTVVANASSRPSNNNTITTAVIALVFAVQAHAHAAVSPVLGVAGTPVRGDVKRPLTLGFIKKPCGLGVNIAANLDTSTPVVAQPDGTFNVTVTNFNLGIDGSRKMSLLVDPTGTGKNMVAGTISTNGDPAPGDLSSEVLAASLPAGMTCTGGASGNLCLASFKSTFGFGNCVVIQQSPSTASNSTAATTAATTSAAGTSVAADPTTASGASPLASDSTSAAVDGTTADA
ncbi:hypothetical protein H0H93_000456, partial [Arthromyces matolae]